MPRKTPPSTVWSQNVALRETCNLFAVRELSGPDYWATEKDAVYRFGVDARKLKLSGKRRDWLTTVLTLFLAVFSVDPVSTIKLYAATTTLQVVRQQTQADEREKSSTRSCPSTVGWHYHTLRYGAAAQNVHAEGRALNFGAIRACACERRKRISSRDVRCR